MFALIFLQALDKHSVAYADRECDNWLLSNKVRNARCDWFCSCHVIFYAYENRNLYNGKFWRETQEMPLISCDFKKSLLFRVFFDNISYIV